MAHLLSVNAGSTSVKYKLFTPDLELVLSGHIENNKGKFVSKLHKLGQDYSWEISETQFNKPVGIIAKEISDFAIDKVGFRIVHGGEQYIKLTKLTAKVMADLKELNLLAPLHNPPALRVIHQFKDFFPKLELFGIFDTAFHATIAPEQFLYSLPYEFYSKLKIRKYGFHGISHQYIYERIKHYEKKYSKVVSCHLGGGASITAIKNGKSFDTSMGFTPLEGLTMATRAGDIDTGVIFYLAEKEHYEVKDIKAISNNSSGLLGISGVTSDMRKLLELEKQGHERAHLAVEIYIYDIVRYIGAYIAAMDGIDVLAFSGGIGSGSFVLRKRICDKLGSFKVKLAKSKNDGQIDVAEDLKISNRGSIPVWVIPADEEKQIAKELLSIS